MTITSRTILKVLGLTTVFVVGLMLVYLVRRELVWIGTAFFLSVALNPAVERTMSWMPRRNRGMAIGSVFLAMVALLLFLIVALAPPLVHQSGELAGNLPGYTSKLVHGNSVISRQIRGLNLAGMIQSSQDQIVQYASRAGGSVFVIARGVFSSFAAAVTVLGLTFFMLLEGPNWVRQFWRIVPPKRLKHAQLLVGQMYEAVTGYVTGNLLTSLLAAMLVAITLTIIGVPFAIALGILVGIFDLLPLVGATIGATIVILVSLFTSVAAAIIMLVFFIIYQQLENHLLQPVVYGRTVRMSPLLVLVSVLLGVGVGGIVGAIVAIPIGASVQIVVKDIVDRRLPGRRAQAAERPQIVERT